MGNGNWAFILPAKNVGAFFFRLLFGILYGQQPHLSRPMARDNEFVVPSVEARTLIIVFNDLCQ